MSSTNTISSISFALDPSNVPSFLLDWEVTKKCNLDCSYCPVGVDGGHDNSLDHPPLDECLRTIDFMYEYVDLYMQHRKPTQRKVVLNLYGGESISHPNIIEILNECRIRYQKYAEKWHLTVTCTTNGIIGNKRWEKIVPLVDEFTVSYHAEISDKQYTQFINNIKYLSEQQKPFTCVVMMHNNPKFFAKSEEMIEFCQQNNLRYIAKPLDNTDEKWAYNPDQYQVLKSFWVSKSSKKNQDEYKEIINDVGSNTTTSVSNGRTCCGGRKLSINGDIKSSVTFVPKQGFNDWYCSVNWFFLFVQQVTGKVYTNKDCRMSTTGKVEPLGTIAEYEDIITTLKDQFTQSAVPVIQCKKPICRCGFCAPKAKDYNEFLSLIKRTAPNDLYCKLCDAKLTQ